MGIPKATPVGRRTLVATAVWLCLLALPAWAEVDQATLEKADAMLKSGQAESAYQLLEPLEIEGAGDLVYDYLLGTAALESNRPSKATFIYERILAVAPSYIGVRADMGRAYFALGDFGRAKIEFETVLAFQNLPNDLRGSVEQYVKAAEARSQSKPTVANGYIEVGLGSDSNIGSANGNALLSYPGSPGVAAGTYAPGKKSDNYATLGMGGEVNHQFFCDNTCNYTVDARGGVSYSGGSWLLRGGLTAGQYNLNQVSYRDTTGITVDWRLALNNGSQLSAGASTTRAAYLSSSTTSQNTRTNTWNVGWLTPVGDGSAIFSLSASGGVEVAEGGREDGNRDFYGPRVLFQKSFSETVGAYATMGATASKYAGTNALYGTARNETLYDLALGLTWSLRKGLSLRPQLSQIKNDSNASLYAYEKTDVSVNLRLDF
jgi:outer membrane protein